MKQDEKDESVKFEFGADAASGPDSSVLAIVGPDGKTIDSMKLQSVSINRDPGDSTTKIKGMAKWSAKGDYVLSPEEADALGLGIIGSALVRPRSCDGCTACCKVLEVSTLDKPADKWCRYCKIREGCMVHDFKPPECTSYECMWTLGIIRPPWARPDRLRTVFDAAYTERWGIVARAWEVSAGGLRKPDTGTVIAALCRRGTVATRSVDGNWRVFVKGEPDDTAQDVARKRRELTAAIQNGTAWAPPLVTR